MQRLKLILVGIVAMLLLAMCCSSCTPKYKEDGYSITTIYKHSNTSMAIYKVKTPNNSYTILRDRTGGMVILK